MQQDAAEMQTDRQLCEVRSFSFGSNRTDICHVEKLIIDKYLGIPYKHRGRTTDGLDCWGLLKLVYADLGFRLFDIEDLEYEKAWSLRHNYFKEHCANDWDRVTFSEVLDAVLFFNSRRAANHAGIILKDRKFIHCCRAGVIISKLDDEPWKKRIEGYYRLKHKTW